MDLIVQYGGEIRLETECMAENHCQISFVVMIAGNRIITYCVYREKIWQK